MFVVYRVVTDPKVKYERMKEFRTLEEAEEFLNEQTPTVDVSYTIMME